jgi:6-phosphogluconolactonase
MRRLLPVAFITPAVLATSDTSVAAADLRFYVGTYTKKEGSKGIYLFRLNSESGALTAGGLVAETKNPTFLALHPNRRLLYSVNETEGSGGVSAYAIGADNRLAALNSKPSRGAEACHLVVDGTGKYVLVANYGGGSVAALPIHDDGTLGEATGFVQHTGSGPNARRQERPHAHSIYTQGGFVYACDLGTDQVLIYRLEAQKGTLTPNDPRFAKVPPGSGPRHLAFHDGFAYVINEMLNTITGFKHDATTGALEQVQEITTLPEGFAGQNTTAEISVHPNGRFLYGSNRGHNSIAVFAIGAGGRLTFVEHTSTQGRGPRNFALDLSGRWLLAANQETSNIVVFKVDAASGRLTPAGQTAELGSPVCVTFGP